MKKLIKICFDTNIESWIHNIKNNALLKSNVVGDHLNELFYIDLIKPLLNICSDFLLWSDVIVEHFASLNLKASSARVEG